MHSEKKYKTKAAPEYRRHLMRLVAEDAAASSKEKSREQEEREQEKEQASVVDNMSGKLTATASQVDWFLQSVVKYHIIFSHLVVYRYRPFVAFHDTPRSAGEPQSGATQGATYCL